MHTFKSDELESRTKKYKIIIAYDGSDYAGWQRQKDDPCTVAGVLEQKFADVFSKQIFLAGASRTDAGVHALGQVAAFETDLLFEPNKIVAAWHNSLPESISIRNISPVDLDFNPRRSVAQKIYMYHFFTQRALPMLARYGWHYRYPVDLNKLRSCFKVFVGTHDFRSFCTGNDCENTVRTIDDIYLESFDRYGVYRIVVKGPGFLRYMIRRIVGACLEVASRPHLKIEDLVNTLAACNPEHLLPTAPAKGLLLKKIRYTLPSEE